MKGFFDKLGIRFRLILALGTAAGLVTLGLLAVELALVPSLAHLHADRLVLAGRSAAAGAPDNPDERTRWAAKLSERLAGIDVRLLTFRPGAPGFLEECRKHRLTADRVMAAYTEGESLANSFGEEIDFLVRVGPPNPVLLGLSYRDHAGSPPGDATVEWVLLAVLWIAIAISGGYLIGYFLIVHPVATTAIAIRKVQEPASGWDAADLPSLREEIAILSKRLRDEQQRSERQSVELDRIRSDLKGAQATLLRAEKLASVGQLAAGVAHEIGNPLGVILGLSSLMKASPCTEEEVRRFAGEIEAATQRAHGIIRDLLSFARPSREEGAVSDVEQVVQATLKLLKPQKRFRDVSVDFRSSVDGPLLAEIRGSQLQQVVLNLLLNAADAMGGRGKIAIRAWKDERCIYLEVEDGGPGIPPEILPRVFDPFFTTKPPGEGTGLGLAMSAQIIGVYGGELRVSSPPGKGACFTIRLWRPSPTSS